MWTWSKGTLALCLSSGSDFAECLEISDLRTRLSQHQILLLQIEKWWTRLIFLTRPVRREKRNMRRSYLLLRFQLADLNDVGYQICRWIPHDPLPMHDGIALEMGVRLRFFKVLAKLEEAWINERNSPELLHPRMEMVEESKASPRNKITHF